MDDIVAKLASDCSDLLKADPGPEGRAKVAALLSEVISNPEFPQTGVTPKQTTYAADSATAERGLHGGLRGGVG